MSDSHYTKEVVNGKYKYTYVCVDCQEPKTVTYIPKEEPRCASCTKKILAYNMSQMNIKKKEDKKRYEHICPSCGSIRLSTRKYKTQYCADCSSKRIGESNRLTEKDKKPKVKKEKKAKKPRKTTRYVSKEAIEKERKKNQQYREQLEAEQSKKVEVPKQKLSDDEMIKAFYRTKKPSVIDTVKKIPHLVGTTYIKGYDM